MDLSALAPELEAHGGARDGYVVVPQGSEPEGVVGAGILVVSHPDAGQLEQPDHGREHLLPGQPGTAQVLLDPRADSGERLTERQHAAELGLVAYHAPPEVVAVLLPAPRVP